MKQRGQPQKLTDIDVEAVGLVKKGANRKPFFFVNSQDHGGEGMSDNVESVLQELEAEQEVNKSMLDKAISLCRDLYSQLRGGEGDPQPTEGEPDAFAEAVETAKREMEEKFSAQLAEEKAKREEFAQAYEAERRTRRLAEFGQVVREDFSQLATGEDFAEALLSLNDHSPELYEKFHAVLTAANATVKEAGIFTQRSKAGTTTQDPFLAKVEQVRQERFNAMDSNEGFVAALEVVASEHPDLAANFDVAGGD